MTSNFDKDGLWGKCGGDDDGAKPSGPGSDTTKGKKCHLPFTYKNETYKACTHVDHAWPW